MLNWYTVSISDIVLFPNTLGQRFSSTSSVTLLQHCLCFLSDFGQLILVVFFQWFFVSQSLLLHPTCVIFFYLLIKKPKEFLVYEAFFNHNIFADWLVFAISCSSGILLEHGFGCRLYFVSANANAIFLGLKYDQLMTILYPLELNLTFLLLKFIKLIKITFGLSEMFTIELCATINFNSDS